MALLILIGFLLFYLGATMMSFFTLVGNRLLHKQSILGRSHCDHCQKQLAFVAVLPVIGFFVTKGRCPECRQPILRRYLVFELLGGAFFVLAWLSLPTVLDWILFGVAFAVFAIETEMDVLDMTVSDPVWIVGFVMVMAIQASQGWMALLSALLSAAVLFVVMLGFSLLGKKLFHQESLGGGDVKLYLFVGALLSWQLGLVSIVLASFFGLVYALIYRRKKAQPFAFVPAIFLSVMTVYLYGQTFLDWYFHLLERGLS